MKKVFCSFILLLVPFCASAYDFDNWCCEPNLSLEGRIAYFRPYSDRMQRFYGDARADYQLELLSRFCCDWAAFLNVSYSRGKDNSRVKYNCGNKDFVERFSEEYDDCDTKSKHHVRVVPITVGLKRYFCYNECLRPYFGAGIGLAHARFKNRYDFVERVEDRFGLATLVKLGLECDICDCFFVDIFADWAWDSINYHKKHSSNSQYHPQTGGLKVGIGFGYHFY